jgi:hypothetical protein
LLGLNFGAKKIVGPVQVTIGVKVDKRSNKIFFSYDEKKIPKENKAEKISETKQKNGTKQNDKKMLIIIIVVISFSFSSLLPRQVSTEEADATKKIAQLPHYHQGCQIFRD